MAKYLRQSTASQEILLGPFVDSTDGVTAETALTINNTDIKIHKAGATTLANKNLGGGTHISNGNYYAVLDATDTDTAGNLNVVVQVSGALAFRDSYVVLPEYVYDSMLAPTAITGGYGPNGVVDSGTLQSATGTTAVLRSAASFADDRLNGMTIVITGGTGVGQARVITDYADATDTATVDTWTTTPDNTSTYIVLATPPASATAVPAVNVTQWNGSAVATPTVAGVPEVDITHIGGSAVSTTTAQIGVNVVQISGDATAADNLESYTDGTDLIQVDIRQINNQTIGASKPYNTAT